MPRLFACSVAVVMFLAATLAARQAPSTGAASNGITAVEGILVGHHTLTERPTGCTVILVDGPGAMGGKVL